MVKDYCKYY